MCRQYFDDAQQHHTHQQRQVSKLVMSLSEVSCQTEEEEEEEETDGDNICGRIDKLLDNKTTVRDFSKHDALITNQLVCSQLAKRWILDVPYTSFGPFVLSYVTPQRPLDESIYSDEIKQAYATSFTNNNFNPAHPPHLYSLLNWQLWSGRVGLQRRQSLLLTGETGSGKSTNLTQTLAYLAFLGRNNSVANDVLEFNRALDTFGSAATTHNPHGSTRFTKWIELGFDVTGNLLSAQFATYNLDKWRLLPSSSLPSSSLHNNSSANGENTNSSSSSNFLVFYVILAAAEPALLKSLGLVRNVDSYRILAEHRRPPSSSLSPESTFRSLRRVLSSVLGSPSHTHQVFRILAAILKLGNISFSATTKIDGSEGVAINHFKNNNGSSSTSVSSLLGVPGLESLLQSTPSWTDSNELTSSLMLTLYSRLFSWLTTKLSIQQPTTPQSVSFKLNLLDFTGGAVGGASHHNTTFDAHLVETLNAEIQTLVDTKLREMQETFSKDNLEWITIDTKATTSSSSSSKSRSSSSHQNLPLPPPPLTPPSQSHHHLNNSSLPPPPPPLSPNLSLHPQNTPCILPPTLTTLLSTSSNPLISTLFSLPTGGKPLTPLAQLSINIKTLKLSLLGRRVSYVKCIRPSESLTSWDQPYVRFQVEHHHRLVDHTKVLKLSHVYSFTTTEFLHRYKLLSLKTWPTYNQTDLNNAPIHLLNDLCFHPHQDYLKGNQHIFFRHINILLELESYREERLEDLALLIQKTYRGFAVRKKYRRIIRAQTTIARALRAALRRKHVSTLLTRKRRRRAAALIQRAYILWKRRMYLKSLCSVLRRRRGSMLSPVCKEWPVVPSYLQETNSLLKILFHRWRCRLYRYRVSSSAAEMARLNEKATASVIFRGNKASYARSISHPFLGDYIRLRQNSQWRRTMSMTSFRDLATDNDNAVVFADLINKVTRSSGKFLPIVLAVTKTSLIILDPRSLTMKYRLSIEDDLDGVSMSRCLDDIVVLHVNANTNNAASSSSTSDAVAGTTTDFFQHNCISCSSHQQQHHHQKNDDNIDDDNEDDDNKIDNDDNDHHHQNSSSGGGCLQNSEHHHQHGWGAAGSKGDLILHTCHAVEMVTKIFLVHKNLNLARKRQTTSHLLPIHFANEFDALFGNQRVSLSFRYDEASSSFATSFHHPWNDDVIMTNNAAVAAAAAASSSDLDDDTTTHHNEDVLFPPNNIGGAIMMGHHVPPPPVIPPSCIKVKKKCARMEFVLRPQPPLSSSS